MTQIMFPLFCFNDRDMEAWTEDPAEFLRQEADFVEDFWDPRVTALNVLVDLIALRGEEHLHVIAGHSLSVLQRYQQTDPQSRNPREKDGALLVLGNLAAHLKRVKQYEALLEPMIITHVLPEFQSQYPFLRARTCWAFGQFFDAPYSQPEVFYAGLRAVLQCLSDQELPVRVKAALALRTLCLSNMSTNILKELLPQLLEVFFRLMKEIEHEDLLKTLQILISKFSNEMAPFAVALIHRLVENFVRFSSADEEDENSAMAAVECLTTIETILDSVCKIPETHALYAQIEPVIMPLLVRLMEQDAMDFFDEGIKIISYLTFYGEGISQNMWALFPLIYRAFMGWAVDWMDNLIVPLDNFISRGTDTFLSNPDNLNMVLAMYNRLVGEQGLSEVDCGEGAKLIEVVLHNCRGRIDSSLPGILYLAVARLLHPETKMNSLKVLLLEVVANSLFYNPALTLGVLEQRQWTQQVFQTWLQMAPAFSRAHDKKVAILGLSSIIGLPQDVLPASMRGVMTQIVQFALKFLYLLGEQRKAQEAEAGSSDDDDDGTPALAPYGDDEDPDDEDEGPIPEDQDVDADYSTITRLSQEAAEYSYNHQESEEDELVDEAIYTSPIDDVDEVVFFVQNMKAFADKDAQPYSGVIASLAGEEQNFFGALVRLAQEKVAAK